MIPETRLGARKHEQLCKGLKAGGYSQAFSWNTTQDEKQDKEATDKQYEGGWRSAGVVWAATCPATAPAVWLDREKNGRAILVEFPLQC